MAIKEGKLEHHCVIGYNAEKKLHLVGNGDMHYGHWLMTSEELVAEKKWEDDCDNISEWNKFTDYAIWEKEKA